MIEGQFSSYFAKFNLCSFTEFSNLWMLLFIPGIFFECVNVINSCGFLGPFDLHLKPCVWVCYCGRIDVLNNSSSNIVLNLLKMINIL